MERYLRNIPQKHFSQKGETGEPWFGCLNNQPGRPKEGNPEEMLPLEGGEGDWDWKDEIRGLLPLRRETKNSIRKAAAHLATTMGCRRRVKGVIRNIEGLTNQDAEEASERRSLLMPHGGISGTFRRAVQRGFVAAIKEQTAGHCDT